MSKNSVAIFCLGLCASPASSQDAQFLASVDTLVTGFEQAVIGEYMVSYTLANEHPLVLDANAQLRDISIQTYADVAQEQYTEITQSTQINAFQIHRDAQTIGIDPRGSWAVYPFTYQLTSSDGAPGAVACNQVIVYQDQGLTFLSVITDERSREIAVWAAPQIDDILNASRTEC